MELGPVAPVLKELPPRARRIPPGVMPARLRFGTTSACAENTPDSDSPHSARWNYLRVRGEYSPVNGLIRCPLELPPRARRILKGFSSCMLFLGTTSACAENTPPNTRPQATHWNYLRVRGEYTGKRLWGEFTEELPPRARRIQACGDTVILRVGTTSACAENTPG